MAAVIAIVAKDLRQLFFSPVAAVAATLFTAVLNLLFALVFDLHSAPVPPDSAPLALVFGGTFFFWLLILVMSPAITMRAFAEEVRSGTFETLSTAPVTSGQIVFAKFVAAVIFYGFLWLPTLVHVAIIEAHGTLDYGPVLGAYAGTLLLGGVLLAGGILASALTRSQVVAFAIGFLFAVSLYAVGFLENVVEGPFSRDVVRFLSLQDRFDDFPRGILDARDVLYYASLATLFLFAATQALENRR